MSIRLKNNMRITLIKSSPEMLANYRPMLESLLRSIERDVDYESIEERTQMIEYARSLIFPEPTP